MTNKHKKEIKALDLEKNQKVESTEGLFPWGMRNDEMTKLENKIKQNNLKYETNKYEFDFQ